MTMSEEKTAIQKTTEKTIKEEQIQTSKDRTLFCVNIDQRCTEDILYELFLQSGPIENLVRKADRNGNLICLITYKYLESCEYAIELYNGISLFGQSLKVQFCQNSSNQSSNNNASNVRASLGNSRVNSTPNSSQNSNIQSRLSMETLQTPNINQIQPQQLVQLMVTSLTGAQPYPLFASPAAQPFSPFNNNSNSGTPNSFNRSKSGSNIHEYDIDDRPQYQTHQSRRNNSNNPNYDRQFNARATSGSSKDCYQNNNNHNRSGSNWGNQRNNAHSSAHSHDSKERKFANASNRSRSRSPIDRRRKRF